MISIIKIQLYVLILITVFCSAAQSQNLPGGVKVRKIWSNDKYNAFTSLLYFKGSFYCSFREGESHVYGKEGVTRIISSKDGVTWKSVAVLSREGYDLRDPKLSVTPGGRIMVIIGGSVYKGKELMGQLTHVSFSDRSGSNFSHPEPVHIPNNIRTNFDWLWRVTWYKHAGYGVVYQKDEEWPVSLLKTTDGIHYDLVKRLEINGKPNETTVRLMQDKEMLMMIRREAGDKEGMWGRSMPPYINWEWKKLGMQLGGPDFIALEDNIIVSGTRVYDKKGAYTALFAGDRSGIFRKIFDLPSGGDNSYPGFVYKKRKLFVSYYSSHEGKASIYFAEVPIDFIIP